MTSVWGQTAGDGAAAWLAQNGVATVTYYVAGLCAAVSVMVMLGRVVRHGLRQL